LGLPRAAFRGGVAANIWIFPISRANQFLYYRRNPYPSKDRGLLETGGEGLHSKKEAAKGGGGKEGKSREKPVR